MLQIPQVLAPNIIFPRRKNEYVKPEVFCEALRKCCASNFLENCFESVLLAFLSLGHETKINYT